MALGLSAMATRFEIVLHGGDPRRLRAAGEAALAEIQATERRLSRFRPESDISRINAGAGGAPVRVDARTARLLASCAEWHRLTSGALDVTIGPLVDLWREARRTGVAPSAAAVAVVRERVGMSRVALDVERAEVALEPGTRLDLGAVGKGDAIDRAVAALAELEIPSALVHGGTSSVRVLGRAPSGEPWRIAVGEPVDPDTGASVELRPAEALAVSSQRHQSFEIGGVRYGHVIDPRSGWPVGDEGRTALVGPTALLCDVLSTAALVLRDRVGPALAACLVPGCRVVTV